MNLRTKCRDVENRDTISRLEEIIGNTDVSIVWHAKCYSLFTSKDKIQRLQKKLDKSDATAELISSPRRTRSQTEQVDWDTCAFCQVHTKERLSSVMTFKMSEHIIEIAKFNYKLRIRLAGVSYLIATEGKYHLSCFSAFKRFQG